MLKQGKAWHHGNRKGSVLLTVVIMVMVLFTLTSICLDVIHHSTRMSSRNVQKTQAKLTAEKVLTEFIEGYKAGKLKEYAGDEDKKKNLFADLMTDYALGTNAANPKVIDVSMVDTTTGNVQSDFDDNFGKTELHIYMTGPSSFVVESVCTYSTQTQTASVYFSSTSTVSRMVSHTVESQLGKLIGEQQLTNGIDGSIYIEKSTNDNSTYKKLSRTTLKAHLYSEFSVRLDDQYVMKDMNNTSRGNNAFQAPANDFDQAPTLITKGYLTTKNDGNSIGTAVGKIDANKRAPGTPGYDPNNLGNYDGFVKVDKKLILTKGSQLAFGAANTDPTQPNKNQIDIYTHGIIFGKLLQGDVDGHNFETESEQIRNVFPKSQTYVDPSDGQTKTIGDCFFNDSTNSSTNIHGNVYSYVGSNTIEQDGSISLVGQSKLVVDGDVYVEGNIYFFDGDGGHPLIKCKNLYCQGNIYKCSVTGAYTADTMRYVIADDYDIYKISSGKVVTESGAETSVLDSYIDVSGTIGNTIDKTKVRNNFPEEGYDAQTGFTQDKTLSQLYGGCSANDIFAASVDESGAGIVKEQKYIDASKHISSKYADAMTRSWTMDPSTKKVATSSTFKYKDPYTGAIDNDKKVVEDLLVSPSNGYCFYQINGSVKLTYEQVMPMQDPFRNIQYVGYKINLGEEDIVVCLPIGQIGATFRIDRTVRDAKHADTYVYFMYYDPEQMTGSLVYKKDANGNIIYEKDAWGNDKYGADGKRIPVVDHTYTGDDACLYFKAGSTTTTLTTTSASGGSTYSINPQGADASSGSTGAGLGAIWMGSSGSPTEEVIVGDMNAVGPTDIVDNFKHTKFDNKDGDSVIMYLVPNDVGFTFLKGGNGMSNYGATSYTNWQGNGSKAWRAQGLVYGVNSNLKIGVFESNSGDEQSGLLGQIKGLSVTFLGDNKMNHKDCPMGEGSLLDYVGVKNNSNSSSAVVKLLYYQY